MGSICMLDYTHQSILMRPMNVSREGLLGLFCILKIS